MTGAMKASINKTIEETVRQQFAGVQIDDVRIERDTDYDGDDVFRITVVFSAKDGLDAERTKGLVRHVRASLAERDEQSFPIISFRSFADDKRLKSAAA